MTLSSVFEVSNVEAASKQEEATTKVEPAPVVRMVFFSSTHGIRSVGAALWVGFPTRGRSVISKRLMYVVLAKIDR